MELAILLTVDGTLALLLALQVFGETPMADVEMIFPEKSVGFKSSQLLRLMLLTVLSMTFFLLLLFNVSVLTGTAAAFSLLFFINSCLQQVE